MEKKEYIWKDWNKGIVFRYVCDRSARGWVRRCSLVACFGEIILGGYEEHTWGVLLRAGFFFRSLNVSMSLQTSRFGGRLESNHSYMGQGQKNLSSGWRIGKYDHQWTDVFPFPSSGGLLSCYGKGSNLYAKKSKSVSWSTRLLALIRDCTV